MLIKEYTYLTALSPDLFPRTLREQLKYCWIETLEEFLSILNTLRRSEQTPKPELLLAMDGVYSVLSQTLPQEVLTAWMDDAENHPPQGTIVPDDYCQLYTQLGALRQGSAIQPLFKIPPLPTSVNLIESFHAVQDQGERGICVACATAALTEYVKHCDEHLSLDFIYDSCKKFDGYAGVEGTDLSTALSAVSLYGICTESTYHQWQNAQINEDELMNRSQRNRLKNIRTVLLGVIEDYKMKLSGANGMLPMPIAVSTMVFESTLSPTSTITGKWTLPLPGEAASSHGHAMLLVGYQDDVSVPGGGFFIARNSWGTDWAACSPIGLAGYALVPYEYVQRFCTAAFTGPEVKKNIDSFRRYIRTLDKDSRDSTGRLLKAGKQIICSPETLDCVVEDTPENRKQFAEQHFAWTESQRIRNFFPACPADVNARSEEFQWIASRFRKALEQNLSLVSSDIFQPKQGFLGNLFSSKSVAVTREIDLSDALYDYFIYECMNIPKTILMPESWRKLIRTLTHLDVWKILRGNKYYHIVSGFLTPIRFALEEQPCLTDLTMEMATGVMSTYTRWQNELHTTPETLFLTLGSCNVWKDFSTILPLGTRACFSTYDSTSPLGWKISMKDAAVTSPFGAFMDQLRPITVGDILQQVKKEILRKQSEDYRGNLSDEKIAEWTGLKLEEIDRAFAALEQSGVYEVYSTHNTKAIRVRSS